MATSIANKMTDNSEIERYLQPIEVISYFVTQEQSTNHDLIKEFRPVFPTQILKFFKTISNM